MKNKIRWGVIGLGGIARRRMIPEGIISAQSSELKAVFDVNRDINIEVAKQFCAHAADSIGQLLSSDIDAVYIATPVNLHCEQTIACAKTYKWSYTISVYQQIMKQHCRET